MTEETKDTTLIEGTPLPDWRRIHELLDAMEKNIKLYVRYTADLKQTLFNIDEKLAEVHRIMEEREHRG